MSAPRRAQRGRGRGRRPPAGAVFVGRPSEWGNPFRITRSSDYHGLPGSWFLLDRTGATYHPDEDTERSARQKAVDLFAEWLVSRADGAPTVERIRAELAGRVLVCWCPRQEPCHADVLLAIANSTGPVVLRPGLVPALPLVRPEPVAPTSEQRPGAVDRIEPFDGGTCPGCGAARPTAPQVSPPNNPDVSVADLAGLRLCHRCGHDPDRRG